ncbi:MAG: hypothetical protein Q9221_007444 [Calogaya cf. arnoldii]
MIKGSGTFIAVALSLTSVHSSDPDTKFITSSVAGSVSVVQLFLLNALTDWAKGQGSLNKKDAAIIKFFSEWSKTALEKAGDEKLACPELKDLDMVTTRQRLELKKTPTCSIQACAANFVPNHKLSQTGLFARGKSKWAWAASDKLKRGLEDFGFGFAFQTRSL